MKKILLAALVLCACLALPSCGSAHKKGERVYNDTHHWYGCKHLRCDARLEEEPHSWDSGEVIKEALEGVDGLKAYVCTVCGAVKNEKIPAPPKMTVTQEGWNNAFSTGNFSNVTATLTEKIQSGDKVIKIEYKILADGALVYLTTVRYENDEEVSYSAKLQDGYYQWHFAAREEKLEDVAPVIVSSSDVMTAENILKNYNLDFTDLYSSFTYDSENKRYFSEGLTVGTEQMSMVEVYMQNGKISRVSATVGNGAEITVSLSDYGKTVPKR